MSENLKAPMIRTAEDLRQAMRLRKLRASKTGYEASVTGDTPADAVTLAVLVDARYLAEKAQGLEPTSKPTGGDRSEAAPWMDEKGRVHGAGGTTGGRNHAVEALAESYVVKIDLTRNTKGVGWNVTVKPSKAGVEGIAEALVLLRETQDRLAAAFSSEAKQE